MNDWLLSVMEVRRWLGKLGERLSDVSMKVAVSISGGAAAGGGVGNVNRGGNWGYGRNVRARILVALS